MPRKSAIKVGLIVGLTVAILGQRETQADDVDFVLKQATYAGNGGVFRCEAKLVPDDTATFNLTVPEDKADETFASIHTSFPAKLSRSPPNAAKNVVITVSVTASTAVTAGITYRTEFDVADSYSIRYGIQQSAVAGDPSALNGYLHVHDKSNSDAQWSDAKLLIKRPPLADICRLNVKMDAGQTYISPIAKLVKYEVNLAEPKPSYLRTFEDGAFKVVQLTNLGDQILVPGNIRVMGATGIFLYGTELKTELGPNDSADLLTTSVKSVKVSVNLVEDRWHEAISVDHGVLKYRPWSVTETVIDNQSKEEFQVRAEGAAAPETVPQGKKKSFFGPVNAKGKESSTDLFDLSKEKLELHAKKLKEFKELGDPSCCADLLGVRDLQQSILDLTNEMESLATSIASTVARIDELTHAGADELVINFYVDRLDAMKITLAGKEKTKSQEIEKLVKKLMTM